VRERARETGRERQGEREGEREGERRKFFSREIEARTNEGEE